MSQLPAQYVKRGMWVNEENGPVLGRTITTDSRTGTLVVAILAVMTAFGTSHLWNIVTFSYHQMRVNNKPCDGLIRQQQALLRTQPTPGALVWEWLKLWWAWRYRARDSFRRSLPQLLLGILFTVGTVVASLSTSYIVSTSNVEVLVQSPLCGPTQNLLQRVNGSTPAASDYYAGVRAASVAYSGDCYSNLSHNAVPERCGSFIRPNIPFRRERITCPFQDTFCTKIDKPGISFDSGLVDLNTGFGLNLPDRDRVQYRRKTNCGLIDIQDHYSVTNVTASENGPEDKIFRLYLGQWAGDGSNITSQTKESIINLNENFFLTHLMKYGSSAYSSLTTLEPLPEMVNEDADVTLIIIQPNRISYDRPVDDPLFSAHKGSEVERAFSNETLYLSDNPFLVAGCEVQHQYCYARPSEPAHCTKLSHLPGPLVPGDYPGASDIQLSALKLLIDSAASLDIETVSDSLKASSISSNVLIPSLPNDQWTLEISGWESAVWAGMQMMIADFSIGVAARIPTAAAFQNKSTSTGDIRLCQMQRMRNPGGFVNINLFGLAFALTLCCVFIAIDFILLKFLVHLERFRKNLAPRIDAWIQDGTFQLQRRAYEAHGKGTWEKLDEEIPVTKRDEDLGSLPLASLPQAIRLSPSHCQCASELLVYDAGFTLSLAQKEPLVCINQLSSPESSLPDQYMEMQGLPGLISTSTIPLAEDMVSTGRLTEETISTSELTEETMSTSELAEEP